MSNILCRAAGIAMGVLVAWLLSWSLTVAMADATGRVTAPERDAVWRAIFARTEAVGPGNPDAAALVALGHDLFHDRRLSGRENASCATCHDPARAFTDGRAKGQGPAGDVLARNVPGLYDLAWSTAYFWDGRAPTLEAQARFPITAPEEMAADFPTITRRLAADTEFSARLAVARPGSEGVTEDAVLSALAAYVRSLASPRSRFDTWVEGDDTALGDEERKGFAVFVGKGGCVSCHGGWRFTDDGFHDIGLPGDDLGRGGRREFKTPSLREVAHTAPYMHDGSLATLADVVDHYAGGVISRTSLAPTLVQDLKLTFEEKKALIAFLNAISSETKDHERVNADEASRPSVQ